MQIAKRSAPEAFRKKLSNNLERGSCCRDVCASICANDVLASVLLKTKIASLIPAALQTNVPLSIAPSLLDRRPAKEIEIATRYDKYGCADDASAIVCNRAPLR